MTNLSSEEGVPTASSFSYALVFGLRVEGGAGLGDALDIAVADYPGFRVAGAHGADEREQGLFLSLGARVAGLVVVVDASDVADGDGAVVHVVLRAVLSPVLVGTQTLVGAVEMDEQMIAGIGCLSGLWIDVGFETLGAVPAVEFGAAHFAAGRRGRAMDHDRVDGCVVVA